IFDWAARGDNPYLAFLGLADAIIVTGDSISMLAEACATGKPVHIFDLGEGHYGMRSPDVRVPRPEFQASWLVSAVRARVKHAKVPLTNSFLPRRLHRDTRAIHRQLVALGRATWLGDDLDDLQRLPLPNDAARVAHRVRALFGSARAE